MGNLLTGINFISFEAVLSVLDKPEHNKNGRVIGERAGPRRGFSATTENHELVEDGASASHRPLVFLSSNERHRQQTPVHLTRTR